MKLCVKLLGIHNWEYSYKIHIVNFKEYMFTYRKCNKCGKEQLLISSEYMYGFIPIKIWSNEIFWGFGSAIYGGGAVLCTDPNESKEDFIRRCVDNGISLSESKYAANFFIKDNK